MTGTIELGRCAKAHVTCTIVAPGGLVVATGANWCAKPQAVCPRAPGEDYTKCKTVCDQYAHAEVDAIRIAGPLAKGAHAYVEGITYACRNCQETLFGAGVAALTIGAPPTPWEGAVAIREIIGLQLAFAPESLIWSDDLTSLSLRDADRIDIAFAIEDRFHIHITDDQRERWRTVGDVISTAQQIIADCE